MIRCKLLAWLLFTLSSPAFLAQSFSLKKMPISVSYYGDNVFHPGIKLGSYHTIWSIEKPSTYLSSKRRDKYGTKRKLKELNLDFNFGGYSHPNSHNGYFLNTGLTFLRTNLRKNCQIGISLEAGYLRRNNKFITYELDSNGDIQEVKGAGNNALLIGLAPQFSKEFSIAEKPVRFYIKPIIQMVHYLFRFQPNASLELGVVLNIHREKKP